MPGGDLVRDGGARQVDALQIGTPAVGGFADGIGHHAALPHPPPHAAPVVPHPHHHAESEAPAALDPLGDAGNIDHALVELFTALFIARPVVATLVSVISSSHIR